MFLLLAAALISAPSFRDVVQSEFPAWDLDHNQVLSAGELDRLVVDSSLTGQRAAALAALKLARRSTKVTYPEFTLEYLLGKDEAAPEEHATSGLSEEEREERAKGQRGLAERYMRTARKIALTKRALFTDPLPELANCHQGALGDCFLVAAIGAAVHRDPGAVQRMIQQEPDGSYMVTFAGGPAIKVDPLTDAQLGLTSTTGNHGLWLPVLEEAYGEWRMKAKPADQRMEEGSDAIAHGGSMRITLRTITGCETESLGLRSKLKNGELSADELATRLSGKLTNAMAMRRLAGLSTDKDTVPPGISPNHAYAVLGFDEVSGIITLWNPHGNTFKPKGPAGLENGYPTRSGVFRLSVCEAVQIFRGATFQTDKPAAKPVGR